MAIDLKSLSSKKIAGVPVLYLAAAVVVIIAIVAWRMKPATEEVTGDESTTTENVPSSEQDSPASDYEGMATQGTVTVVQSSTTESESSTEQTNEDWERAAVKYLIDEKNATATDAQLAISKYLDGANMTYDEGKLRDAAVAKLGLPPERLSNVGTVSAAPAQKQFSLFPGTHTVKNSNDNTPAKLATLYYGSGDAAHANKIVAENYKLGPVGTTYTAGTKVKIPTWVNPRYFTITQNTRNATKVAAKNGISVYSFIALNPGLVTPYKIGSRVRVQ